MFPVPATSFTRNTRDFNPRVLSYAVSYKRASNICQAMPATYQRIDMHFHPSFLVFRDIL
jgi:hypothetical protein